MIMKTFLLVVLGLACGAASAELAGASPTGFVSTHRKAVKAAPAQAFAAIERVDQWWNPAHTYSGKSANLRIPLRAGECFCESWDGHSVEHARVVMVQRDQTLRLEGSLGPLQALPVKGMLTFSTVVEEGAPVVKLSYRVSGPPDAGLEKLAPLVDKVIGEQFQRWAAFADGNPP